MPSNTNPASREGYADEAAWDPEADPASRTPEVYTRPHHAKPHMEADAADDQIVKRYQTPGPGPSAGIPPKDLELSKIDKAVEEIKLTLRGKADNTAAEIRFQLSKIERATHYLKEH